MKVIARWSTCSCKALVRTILSNARPDHYSGVHIDNVCTQGRRESCEAECDQVLSTHSELPIGRCLEMSTYWVHEIKSLIPKVKGETEPSSVSREEYLEYENLRHEKFKQCKKLIVIIEEVDD